MKASNTIRVKHPIYKHKTVWIVSIILLFIGGGVAWYLGNLPGNFLSQSITKKNSVDQTTAIIRGDIILSTSGSGTLVAQRTIELNFPTRGTVIELNVRPGDMVTAGMVLARQQDSAALQATIASLRYQILEAEKTLNDLHQNAGLALAQAYQSWLNTQETYADALAYEQHTAGQRCSRAVNTRYAAALEQAEQKLDHLDPLAYASDSYISAKNDYDTALANYNYCIAFTDAEKTEAQARTEIARYQMQQAQQKYDTLKTASGINPDEYQIAESKLQQLQSQLIEAQADLTSLVMVSPIDGKVLSIAAEAGEVMDTGTYITLADVHTPTIEFSVNDTNFDKLILGKDVSVVFDALPDQVFTGQIHQINPSLTSSGQYKVAKGLIELGSDTAKVIQNLPLGLNATITIISQDAKNVLLAPLTALKSTGDGEYAVMLKGNDGQLRQQSVTIGIKDSRFVEITSGLQEGDIVSMGSLPTTTATTSDNPSQIGPMPGGDMIPPNDGMMPAP